MSHSIVINNKRLGERFALSKNFDLIVVALSHADTKPVEIVRLGNYHFTVRALHFDARCGHETREVALEFNLHNKRNPSVSFEDEDWRHTLSVDFLTFVKDLPPQCDTADIECTFR